MKDFINQINELSPQEKLDLLRTDFSSAELIEVLEKLLELDPKQDTGLDLFDCCGTGGDEANTFNISTTAAIIAAANDLYTCKNGGRSSSSKTGSVDVLEELGVDFSQSLEDKLIGLKRYKLTFHNSKAIVERLAPLKNLARKQKLSSFLSLLGPFTNPFVLKGQIIGVGKKEWFDKVCKLAKHAINKGYTQNFAILQSQDSQGQVFDELCSIAEARIHIVTKNQDFEFNFKPQDFNLKPGTKNSIEGGDNHKENAAILSSILANTANQEKKESALINFAVLKCLDNDDLSQTNIKEKMLESYQQGLESLESLKCQDNWLGFLKA